MKKLTFVNRRQLTIIFAAVFAVSMAGFIITTAMTTGFRWNMNWGLNFDRDLEFSDGFGFHAEFEEEFSSIDLRLTSTRTVIRLSHDDVARVALTVAGELTVSLDAEVRDDTLYISTRWARTFGFNWFTGSSDLLIELPQRHYERVSIDVTSGKVDTHSFIIECDNLRVTTTSGDVNLDSFTHEEYSIKSTAGSVNLYGVSGRGNVELTSGNVVVRYSEWNDSLNVRTTSGSAEFILPEGSGIRVNSRVTSGRAEHRLDGESGRFNTVSNARFGGENVQDAEVNVTSGNVRFVN
jgi:DUF4097 and DUF4098 domain-containing protein YvlB